jgi:hypothetical protein
MAGTGLSSMFAHMVYIPEEFLAIYQQVATMGDVQSVPYAQALEAYQPSGTELQRRVEPMELAPIPRMQDIITEENHDGA